MLHFVALFYWEPTKGLGFLFECFLTCQCCCWEYWISISFWNTAQARNFIKVTILEHYVVQLYMKKDLAWIVANEFQCKWKPLEEKEDKGRSLKYK